MSGEIKLYESVLVLFLTVIFRTKSRPERTGSLFSEDTKPTLQNILVLIFDNHESHISVEVINMAKENGVILLTLPPHCSHKLQPLDVIIYGPFKGYYNTAADKWMLNHPGMTISIYEIAELDFLKTRIYPSNRDIFAEEDFMCSSVTENNATYSQSKDKVDEHCL
ncbi:hypothetical protein NQ318_023560 [Aromia moschata]|uniref:DDE-1 domain-containing protein n=1 Tax=Aromia moschata TaxID=1265417 RepID=A0AAV8YR85_9CUCU|nr:hypothetical protein NQ318_023560 [Aromia moschata]